MQVYGISLILEPAYSAWLQHARQVICSQYGRWAAEMHAVHVPLTGYFACPEPSVPSVDAGLGQVAAAYRDSSAVTYLCRRGIFAEPTDGGSIYLQLTDAGNPLEHAQEQEPGQAWNVGQLQASIANVLASANLGAAGIPVDTPVDTPETGLRFALMQFANLPEPVFQSATRFAQGVVTGLDLAERCAVSEIILYRYESDAVGDDWNSGGWALDLRWQIVNCYPLQNA